MFLILNAIFSCQGCGSENHWLLVECCVVLAEECMSPTPYFLSNLGSALFSLGSIIVFRFPMVILEPHYLSKHSWHWKWFEKFNFFWSSWVRWPCSPVRHLPWRSNWKPDFFQANSRDCRWAAWITVGMVILSKFQSLDSKEKLLGNQFLDGFHDCKEAFHQNLICFLIYHLAGCHARVQKHGWSHWCRVAAWPQTWSKRSDINWFLWCRQLLMSTSAAGYSGNAAVACDLIDLYVQCLTGERLSYRVPRTTSGMNLRKLVSKQLCHSRQAELSVCITTAHRFVVTKPCTSKVLAKLQIYHAGLPQPICVLHSIMSQDTPRLTKNFPWKVWLT